MTEYRVIDAHVHLKHGDEEKTEYSAETIVRIMDMAGVDRSVVFAMSTTTRRSIEMASEAAERFGNRLIPFVYALPSYERPVLGEIEETIGNLGFRGIKIHMGECILEKYVSEPVLRLAAEYDAPCLIDLIGKYGILRRITDEFPETKIIVAHFVKYLCRDERFIDEFIRIAEGHENIFLDTSGVIIPRKIREAVDRLGSDHIIFGTDDPTPDGAEFVLAEIDKIRSLNLNPKDEAAILGGTAAKLLRI